MKKEQLLEIAKKRIDVPNLIFDLIDQIVEPALDRIVKSTETPIDDALKAAIYPLLRRAIEEEIKELWQKL